MVCIRRRSRLARPRASLPRCVLRSDRRGQIERRSIQGGKVSHVPQICPGKGSRAPRIRLGEVCRLHLVIVLATWGIGPVHVKHLVAIIVNLADVADLEATILETEVEPADTGEERIHVGVWFGSTSYLLSLS